MANLDDVLRAQTAAEQATLEYVVQVNSAVRELLRTVHDDALRQALVSDEGWLRVGGTTIEVAEGKFICEDFGVVDWLRTANPFAAPTLAHIAVILAAATCARVAVILANVRGPVEVRVSNGGEPEWHPVDFLSKAKP